MNMCMVLHIAIYMLNSVLTFQYEAVQDDMVVYKHPEYDMQITASSNWKTYYEVAGTGIYEVVNTNNNMHILMWYCESTSKSKPFLREFANMQGFIYKTGPNDTVLNNYHANYLTAACVTDKIPHRVFLAAIGDNGGYFLIQVKCPEDCYLMHREAMESVLASLRIGI